MRNIPLRLLALAIAVFLTLYVNRDGNRVTFSFFVPIEIVNPPKDKLIVRQSAVEIQATVSGPSYVVSKIPESPPTLKVELPDTVGPYYKAALDEHALSLEPSVELQSLEPKEIDFSFEKRATKIIPVVVAQTGILNPDLRLQSISVQPDKVEIVGPESEVSRILSAETYPPIDLSELKGGVSRVLELKIPARLAKPMEDRASVSVKIGQAAEERKFAEIPIQLRAVPGRSFAIKPTQVNVEVSGPKALIEDLKRADIVPFIRPPEGDDWRGGDLQVSVELPDGLEVVSVEPASISVQPEIRHR